MLLFVLAVVSVMFGIVETNSQIVVHILHGSHELLVEMIVTWMVVRTSTGMTITIENELSLTPLEGPCLRPPLLLCLGGAHKAKILSSLLLLLLPLLLVSWPGACMVGFSTLLCYTTVDAMPGILYKRGKVPISQFSTFCLVDSIALL